MVTTRSNEREKTWKGRLRSVVKHHYLEQPRRKTRTPPRNRSTRIKPRITRQKEVPKRQPEKKRIQPKPIDTATHMARELASRVYGLHASLQKLVQNGDDANAHKPMKMVLLPLEKLVAFATRLIQLRQQFAIKKIPIQVDLGFHYTQNHYLASIEKHGLLPKLERDKRNIVATCNGSCQGEGVYTCNDFMGSCKYGNTGIVVVRLKGLCMNYTGKSNCANTLLHSTYAILKTSDQCCPIMTYGKDEFWGVAKNNEMVSKYEKGLRLILDEIFQGS